MYNGSRIKRFGKRSLKEMKAYKSPIPPKPDPRDMRIAQLERAVAAIRIAVPVASHSTSEGRQKNRRVEIRGKTVTPIMCCIRAPEALD